MRRKSVLITALAVVFTSCVALKCTRAPATVAPAADLIAAGLQQQETASGKSLDVTYKYWQVGYESDKVDLRYVRTPQLLFIQRKSDGAVSTDRYDRVNSVCLELHVSADGTKTGYVGGEPRGLLQGQMPMDTVLRPLDGYLVDVVRRGTVSESKSEVDGHPCWAVSAPPTEADSDVSCYVIWVDPDIGFSPRKVDFRWKDEARPTKVVEFRDYREIGNGVWFPMEIRVRTRVQDNGRLPGRLIGDVEFVSRADEATVDKVLSVDELTVTFPSGTRVIDELLQADYVVP